MASADRDIFGRLIFPVLTLGIAFVLKYYVFDQVYDAKKDYFSQLPDDLLPSILEHLPVHDAVRTSILSRRWKYLFASMPTLKFRCLDMSGIGSNNHSCCPHYQQKFLKGVNRLFQHYSGHRVTHIEMSFCYGRTFSTEFEQLMCSVSRVGVETLCLNFHSHTFAVLFEFSFKLLTQASSLKHLFLNYCIVQPSFKVNFIRTLTLEHVFLKSGRLEGILSSCLSLEQLTLKYCRLPLKICVSGKITSLIFFTCAGVDEIDLQARNLCTFECSSSRKVRFHFTCVPALECVMIDLRKSELKSYIFGDFVRDLPAQVKSLRLKIGPSEVNCFQRGTKIFRNLRQLHLVLVDTKDYDIVKIYPLLNLCPLLQCLSLDLIQTRWSAGRAGPLLISPTCHTELKEVTFSGFHGSSAEIEFALYILRSAMVLEQIFLSQRYRCYSGFGKWENMFVSFDERRQNSIQRQLHGQAISKKAAVIFQ